MNSVEFVATVNTEYAPTPHFKAYSKDDFDLFDHSMSFQKGFIDAFITFDGHVTDYKYTKVIRANQSGDRGLKILRQILLSLASFGVYGNLTISKP